VKDVKTKNIAFNISQETTELDYWMGTGVKFAP